MTDKELTPIGRAANELNRAGIINGSDIGLAAAIIKRELEKAVPERKNNAYFRPTKHRAEGYNACRKAIGLD